MQVKPGIYPGCLYVSLKNIYHFLCNYYIWMYKIIFFMTNVIHLKAISRLCNYFFCSYFKLNPSEIKRTLFYLKAKTSIETAMFPDRHEQWILIFSYHSELISERLHFVNSYACLKSILSYTKNLGNNVFSNTGAFLRNWKGKKYWSVMQDL